VPKEVPLTRDFDSNYIVGKAIVQDDGTVNLHIHDEDTRKLVRGNTLRGLSLGTTTATPKPGEIRNKYLVTDGCGMRLPFDDFQEALNAWTNPFWHIYVWRGWEWVQIR